MRWFLLSFCCLCLSACSLNLTVDTNPTTDVTGWETLDQGLAQRTLRPSGDILTSLRTLRIDPTHYTFRAHYRPGAPLTLTEWRDLLPDAVAIVNANFFDVNDRVVGLLVSDGVAYGESYTQRGGTFAVQADGTVRIWSNALEPYRGQPLQQAVQAFPMLMVNGEQYNRNRQQTARSRRTVIAQDDMGRVLLMTAGGFGIGLYDLAAYLPTTDIGLVDAFALDGGGSTMMYIGPADYTLGSLDPVPSVLAVYPR